ncbi:putative C25H2.10c-like protein [Cladobotryum mycophilum]|uniref:C25H2.10c-like protein n=1 Tax=Cladobotryum mycophilum TaxID=491253 RepID=A0ABR0SUC3_9HYPO
MSEAKSKRKNGVGASQDGSAFKKRKEGTAGRWKTPSQMARQAERIEMGTALEVGDEGIWVTYARGMKGKAVREFKELCDEYGEKMYGIKPSAAEAESRHEGDREEEGEQDIESAIQQELNDMKELQKPTSRQIFSPVSVTIECVFFMKTMKPVEPVQFIRKICEDAKECTNPMQRKCRYINRMTPVVDAEKATEKGIKKLVRRVLEPYFSLKEDVGDAENAENAENADDTSKLDTTKDQGAQANQGTSTISYAIRHNVRNHTVFKSSEVIQMIAAMIQPSHKVNLTNPDKVILVEIFQMFCGISVVDAKEWEDLKRYNINALYGMTAEQKSGGGGKKKEDETVTTIS